MKKVSLKQTNGFCPQALYCYGTYKEDGSANFALFSWLSYCWNGELQVMACIGEDKLTRDRIRATGKFSACLVTEGLLPAADYLGHHSGHEPGKMNIPLKIGKGEALDVPVLADSPWCYELQVARTLPLEGGGELYLCRIANILADEVLTDESRSLGERMAAVSPVLSSGVDRYFALKPEPVGAWGDWKDLKDPK
ncbi:MAG: flavin reductase family protein [Christensenellales bacterium]|jgi:flavin reductase (DIM6/NTAB) family NADH-FMN oxidoreductase RutF